MRASPLVAGLLSFLNIVTSVFSLVYSVLINYLNTKYTKENTENAIIRFAREFNSPALL